MKTLPTLIQKTADLKSLIATARKTDAVALDTEFVWERTYFPRLGLIQIGLSDEECFLIDPLSFDNLSPLGDLLTDRSVVKIVHDAPQDLIILGRATDSVPQNIFDTRLAAGFADLPATLSLANLTHELLDIALKKSETRTNWLQRPLSKEQIDYALDDVRYMRAIRILILSRIIGPKIRSWLQEELNLLNNPANYAQNNIEERYLKVRGVSRLDRQGLAILQKLTIWREGVAKKFDRPRGHILKDQTMVEIAQIKPEAIPSLKSISQLSDKARSRYGEAIVAICAKAQTIPQNQYPLQPRPLRLNNSEKKRLERLHNLIELKCAMLGISPEIIGNSSECKKLVKTLSNDSQTESPDLRQTSGWRKTFLQEFLRQNY
mgnify:CR=1 FL=1